MVKYVFGHKTPDTDSIASSIVYADFLNKKGINAKSVKLGETNNETKFVLEHAEIKEPILVEKLPEGSEVVLIDHNEKEQTISNINELKIDTIIDHHKLNLKTPSPVNMRVEKIGSSCSTVYKIFEEKGYKLTHKDATLLLSGIISDTLYFRSPTTTKEDIQIAKKLKKIAKIKDLKKYSLEMFNAKSDLKNIKIEKLIKLDYKEYKFKTGKFGIGVIETTNPDYTLNKKEEIIKKMKKIKKKECLEGLFLSVIDILKRKNITIVSDEKDSKRIKDIFKTKKIDENIYYLGKIISRKKQIVPVLEKNL